MCKIKSIPVKFLTILVALFTIGLLELNAQMTAEELYEEALYKKNAEGTLEEAIKLFTDIVEKFPDNDLYAARAQFQIGICYEKLGLNEAKNAYERVIKNYPDQIEIVTKAKEKLSSLEIAAEYVETNRKDLQLNQVWAKPFDTMGMPSPDGNYISFVNWNVPCLAIYEVSSGEIKNLMSTKGNWGSTSVWAESSIWSPDGQKLAYVWYGEDDLISIRVIGIDSSEPETIYDGKQSEYAHPYSWSSDGNHILTVFCQGKKGHEIVFISVVDKSIKRLKQLEGGSHPWCTLSPDNNYVAYSFTEDLDSPQTNIFLLNVNNGEEEILIDHPATDFNPLWTPDGRNIVFFSDRTGSVSVWSQRILDGKADSDEILIKNLNRLSPMAISSKGELFMTFHEGGYNIFDAVIDPETGKVISEPKRAVESHVGWNGGACFSPDGKKMAYVSQRGVLNTAVSWGQQSLIIRDLQTGEERELIPKLRLLIGGRVAPPKWSPNGDEIVVRGRSEIGHNGIFVINIHDTSFVALTDEDDLIGRDVIWSKDNTKLYFYLLGDAENNGIYLIDRQSGETKKIWSEDNIQQIAQNPNSDQIAFVADSVIKLLNLSDNTTEKVFEFEPEVRHTNIAWSPEGKWLYFTKCLNGKEVELWRLAADRKEAELIDEKFPHLFSLTVHPDGRRLAFTVNEGGDDSSIWVMKNFLP